MGDGWVGQKFTWVTITRVIDHPKIIRVMITWGDRSPEVFRVTIAYLTITLGDLSMIAQGVKMLKPLYWDTRPMMTTSCSMWQCSMLHILEIVKKMPLSYNLRYYVGPIAKC